VTKDDRPTVFVSRDVAQIFAAEEARGEKIPYRWSEPEKFRMPRNTILDPLTGNTIVLIVK
jgi:hypothetical protein